MSPTTNNETSQKTQQTTEGNDAVERSAHVDGSATLSKGNVQAYRKAQRIVMKGHSRFSEKWVQKIISDDPSVLGLGELDLVREELRLPKGRLDLLLEEPDSGKRYEVEIQLGPVDESHIVRSLEYWDFEKRRLPGRDHCAVIVAEDITSRFLNVIQLFNRAIPLIAIQMEALNVGDHITLSFTKVMDEWSHNMFDDEQNVEVTDRSFWDRKSDTINLVDNMVKMIQQIDSHLRPNYTKSYIGMQKDGKPNNFVTFKPRKKFLNLNVKLSQSNDIDAQIEKAGFSTLEYKWGMYRLRLTESDIAKKLSVLEELSKAAYNNQNNS